MVGCSSSDDDAGNTDVTVVGPPINNPPIDNPPIDNPPIDNPPIDNPPIDDPTTTALSCEGSRMWGPVPDPELLDNTGLVVYISEANGREDQDGCRLAWFYDSTQNCSLIDGVSTDIVTQITANSDLFFLQPNGTNFELAPADISVDTLEGLPDCPPIDEPGPGPGPGPIDDTNGPLTALSCDGTRVWGPSENGSGGLVYLSEAGGSEDSNIRDCALFWTLNVEQNCRIVTNIADNATAGVNATGQLAFQVGDALVELNAAGLSFQDLAQITDCP